MNEPTARSEDLLRLMAEAPVPNEAPEAQQERRDRVVPRLSAAIRLEARRREQRRRWGRLAAIVAVAASLLLIVGAATYLSGRQAPRAGEETALAASMDRLHAIEGTVLVTNGGVVVASSPLSDVPLEPGSEVRTPAGGRATMLLKPGVVVDVDASTSVGLVKEEGTASSVVMLTRGRVDVSVPHLTAGSTFAVRTPQAEVVVHGTRFSVVVEDVESRSSITRVEVTEGVVAVRRDGTEVLLRRGDGWSSATLDVAAPASSATASPVADSPTPPSARPATGSVRGPAPAATSPAVSSLAEENRLYQAAMTAKRAGDDARVVSRLSELMARYPSSPLVPNARVERFRALKRMGNDAAAAREARKYLAENPDGFASDEARGAVMSPPASSGPSR